MLAAFSLDKFYWQGMTFVLSIKCRTFGLGFMWSYFWLLTYASCSNYVISTA